MRVPLRTATRWRNAGYTMEPESRKYRALWIALILPAACLVAGCLQPSSVSEEERASVAVERADPGSEKDPLVTPEIPKDTLPKITYLIDTGLYHVGDSWEYESVDTVLGIAQPYFKTQKKFTLVSKRIASEDRIEFDMDISLSTIDYDSNGAPGIPIKSRTRIPYLQRESGLMRASTSLSEPDTNEMIQPGQFPSYAMWKEPEARCHTGSRTVMRKPLLFDFTYWSQPPNPCSGHSCAGRMIGKRIIKALYERSSGLVRLQSSFWGSGVVSNSHARLVARNGVPARKSPYPIHRPDKVA